MSSCYYDVTIWGNKTVGEAEKEGIIFHNEKKESDENEIDSVVFHFDSADNTHDRDLKARLLITIKGHFYTIETLTKMSKLAQWAVSTSDVYANVNIKIFTENNNQYEMDNPMRIFTFDRCFVIDYKEFYGGEDDKTEKAGMGIFELSLAQAPNSKKREITQEIYISENSDN